MSYVAFAFPRTIRKKTKTVQLLLSMPVNEKHTNPSTVYINKVHFYFLDIL